MKRMPDERWAKIAASNDVRPVALFIEADRARAREARLEAALRGMLDAFPAACGSPKEHEARATALRELEAE